MITSLSFAYLQFSSTTPAAAIQPAAAAPAPAPQPVAQDECRGHCDTPRRSPLFRALKDALMEPTQTASTAAGASATGPTATATTTTTTAATSETAATGQTPADADATPDLEDALMEFARTLMQVMRDEFGGRRERAQGHDEGRGHRHHHHGHGRWGDPAQRVEALAQQVSAPATTAAAATASATERIAAPAVGDVTTEPVRATNVADTANLPAALTVSAGSSSTVIFVASIQVSQADEVRAKTSPFAGLHQRLLDAFATLQKAMGKPEAESSDALKSELGTFLQALAARLRGEDAATAEAATQPGALISIAA